MRGTASFASLSVVGVCMSLALSCSGGGGGGTGLPSATTTSSTSSGVITGFGSVKLVGKEYGTQNTSFTVDGQPGSQSDLKVGMVVTVNGSLSSTGVRTASTIAQEDVVEGAVQGIPSTNDRLVVLGQTVLIDNDTVFDNNIPGQNIGGLTVGDLVEVNGFVKGKGLIIATLIEKKNPPATCEVKGIVENYDSSVQSFILGGLTVTYSGAAINDMPNANGNAWNDLLVEVKGSPCTQASQPLIATNVEPERINVANADEMEVEGAITQFNSPGSFTVNGAPVVIDSNTSFEDGVSDDLALGLEVKVEGSLSNGVVTAKEIKFRDNVEIQANVTTVTSGGGTPNLMVSGLPGIRVFVNAQTEFKAGISNLGELVSGDHIRVLGRPTGATTVIASRVDRRPQDTRVLLEGAVQAVADPSVIVLGVTIDTSTIDDGHFEGPKGGAVGRTVFFSSVQVGTVVKARGDLIGGIVRWNTIEIEGGK